MFYKKGLQKINQKEFWDEKVIKRKGDKLYVKWKGYDSFFDMSQYFPEPKSSARGVKVELDLSNYAAKADLKNSTSVDT